VKAVDLKTNLKMLSYALEADALRLGSLGKDLGLSEEADRTCKAICKRVWFWHHVLETIIEERT
jgi:hypothetical protein